MADARITTPENNREDSLAGLLGRMGRMARGLQYAEGLNPAQWECLRFLALANRHSRTPSALAAYLGSTKGTASQTVIALEGKGLLRRVRGGGDRRVTTLEVTEGGDALLNRDPLLSLGRVLAGLPHDVAQSLVIGLTRLEDELTERHGRRSFGVCAKCGHFRAANGGAFARCEKLKTDLDIGEIHRICVDFQPCMAPGAAE